VKALITGKTGYICTSLVKWLKMRLSECEVHTVSIKKGIPDSLHGYDIVIHLAAIVHKSQSKIGKEEYFRVNRDMTIELFEKAIRCGVSHFIFFSTMGVYGAESSLKGKVVINEDSDYAPKTFYAVSKYEAEIYLLNNSDRINLAIVRPPMVYGENCSGNYAKLEALALKTSIFPYVENERSMININNLCELVRLIIKNSSCGIFFPQDAEYINTSRLVQEIALKNGKYISLSKSLGKATVLVDTAVTRKIFGNLVYDKDLSDHFDFKYIVKKRRARKKGQDWDFKL